ncbi:MAG: hypothetical protein IT293_05475 [Deltaproteobacteria bacterium]|nr:hypothetical protein [Deltaproteobacteria bacterium]
MTLHVLPPALRRRSDHDAIREDIAPYRGTSVAERSEILEALCRLAAEQIAARADGRRVLQHQDPRLPAHEQLWIRLVTAAPLT